ncbi:MULTISPECIES: alpha/beta fold hydrolase [Actinomadura]|uniref:Alpha/beta fold hydrolase n=1 Tax=Actinomadura yumaensis TaxID=111807 RepID=A0ABW2CQH2_9ACTN|nr:hypothetical protein [Actinomadura sp. J1-007]
MISPVKNEAWTVGLPRFGRGSEPSGPPDLAGLAVAVADRLEAVDLPEVRLLGSSFGCRVATETAVRRPGRVRSPVLSGPT